MKCPVCTETDLLMAERQGIEIDYCPSCRGVWLDRGELDKIIERASAEFGGGAPAVAPQAPAPARAQPQDARRDDSHGDSHKHDDRGYEDKQKKKKKKSGFIMDVFEGLGG